MKTHTERLVDLSKVKAILDRFANSATSPEAEEIDSALEAAE